MTEHEELRKKEEADAIRKASTRGVPYYILRGRVYTMRGMPSFANGTNNRQATEVEQILWDALAVMG
jgi:hypothetical protein